MFCLLTGKSQETYSKCFSSLINLCSDLGVSFILKIVHTDLENAIIKVIRIFFPSIHIKYCRFHLAQAWWRKTQNLGLACYYKDRIQKLENVKWLKGLFGAACLDHGEILDSFVKDFNVCCTLR